MPTVTLMTNTLDLRARLPADRSYITVLPKSVVRDRDKGRGLRALPVGLRFPPWAVTVFTLRNRTLSPVVERFINCAREVTKSLAKKNQ